MKNNGKLSRTKIIATLGPSSSTREIINEMILNGMSCARINTAHGDFEQYQKIIDLVRESGEIPIMMDIKGPEIRIRTEKELIIKAGETVKFGFAKNLPYFSFDFSHKIATGDVVFFDNGLIEAEIAQINKGEIELRFDEDCTIKPNKGVNIPGKELNIPPLSEKDKEAIEFSIKNNLSFIALSFTRYKEDVLSVRKLLGESKIGIIAKIENHEGIENIDEIIEHSDGIMIARGDLGVELPSEKIPFIQKTIIKKCNTAGKIVIVATQMLESMTASKTPTRAEVSDVATAVLDGADAVMLSGETALGKYPVEAVHAMRDISLEAESRVKADIDETKNTTISQKISTAASSLAEDAKAAKIIVITRSGFTGRQIARYRPSAPIIAVTESPETYLQLKLVWGVSPIMMTIPVRAMMPTISSFLLEKKIIESSDLAVFIGGIRTMEQNVSNVVEIHKIEDLLAYHKSTTH